jgi:MtfA peptidase
MMSIRTLYLIIGFLVLLLVGNWLRKHRGRRTGGLRLRHFAFPPAWLEHLENNVPIYRRLPMDLRERLQDRIISFVDGKRWKHCGGLDAVTDEMKVTIAGQACLLLLGRDHVPAFSKILTIMIYPAAPPQEADGAEALPPVEAWPSASVLLTWDDRKKKARDLRDEGNGIMLEFTRQLDLEDGIADGRPLLGDQFQHSAWARVMTPDFLRDQTRAGALLTKNQQSADPAEVFAAATESFYAKPKELRQRHPALYELLRTFYKLDPARWLKR